MHKMEAKSYYILQQVLLVHLVGLYGQTIDLALTPGEVKPLLGFGFLGNSTDLIWNVTGPAGSQVDLNCTQVTILQNDDCSESFLSILDNKSEVMVCQEIIDYQQLSTENWMILQFKTGPRSEGRLSCLVRLKEKTDQGAGSSASTTVSQDTGDFADQQNDKTTSVSIKKKRVLGGEATGPREYIFMAYIYYIQNNNEGPMLFICGGSILTKRHILTAAHCIDRAESETLQVIVGSDYIATDMQGIGVQILGVQEKYLHVGYRPPDNCRYDIALLILSADIAMINDIVGPVVLPSRRFGGLHELVTVMGWGKTAIDGPFSSVLLSANMIQVEFEHCSRYSPATFSPEDPIQLCTFGGMNIGIGPGDSGGPLIYKIQGFDIQIGVLTNGGNTSMGVLGGSIDVLLFIEWIENKVNEYPERLSLLKSKYFHALNIP